MLRSRKCRIQWTITSALVRRRPCNSVFNHLPFFLAAEWSYGELLDEEWSRLLLSVTLDAEIVILALSETARFGIERSMISPLWQCWTDAFTAQILVSSWHMPVLAIMYALLAGDRKEALWKEPHFIFCLKELRTMSRCCCGIDWDNKGACRCWIDCSITCCCLRLYASTLGDSKSRKKGGIISIRPSIKAIRREFKQVCAEAG